MAKSPEQIVTAVAALAKEDLDSTLTGFALVLEGIREHSPDSMPGVKDSLTELRLETNRWRKAYTGANGDSDGAEDPKAALRAAAAAARG